MDPLPQPPSLSFAGAGGGGDGAGLAAGGKRPAWPWGVVGTVARLARHPLSRLKLLV